MLKLKAVPVHMMDFEGNNAGGVVEYGVVTLLNGEIKASKTGLCSPDEEISTRDFKVHGISTSEASGHPRFEEYFDWFSGLRENGVFAAHNKVIENRFLKNVWPHPPFVPDWANPEQNIHLWGPWIDTLGLYRNLYPGLESYALGQLIERFGLRSELKALAEIHCPAKRSNPHCALYDAIASSVLLLNLLRQDGFENVDLSWVLNYSRAKPEVGKDLDFRD